MGRSTADTLSETLRDRLNIVITSKKDYRKEDGFITYTSLNQALDELRKNTHIHKVFVIGGAILSDDAIEHPRCRRVYLNMIHEDFECDVILTQQSNKKNF
jgi:dihydrofolate reductase